jgi:serine palmitoyltransferase
MIPIKKKIYTYLNYLILNIFGILRDYTIRFRNDKSILKDNNPSDFPPLYQSFESFYTRNIYNRIKDIFNRPVFSSPGVIITLNNKQKAINIGSYNYLGFGSGSENKINISNDSIATLSSRQELGTTHHQLDVENMMANFLGVESCITFGMGFATNSDNIPCLVDSKSLIISDALNHKSIVLGSILSKSKIKVFKHNDMKDLENKLIEGILEKKYNKILIIVEGIYSMEGAMANLPEIIKLKKKYKAYLYLDEAHSIGAIGPNGKGVVDYFQCNPKDVDILMGTFTKSFASAGGYIAGTKQLIDYIKMNSHSTCYASSMSTPVCLQIKYALQNIIDSKDRIKRLNENIKYFRKKLKEINITVYGHPDSPVIPIMLYMPSKIVAFNRFMLERNIAVVTVGYPATDLYGGRARICLSSSHTKEMINYIIECIKEYDKFCDLK